MDLCWATSSAWEVSGWISDVSRAGKELSMWREMLVLLVCTTIHPRRLWTRVFSACFTHHWFHYAVSKNSSCDTINYFLWLARPLKLNCQWRKFLPATATCSNVGTHNRRNFLPKENIFLVKDHNFSWEENLACAGRQHCYESQLRVYRRFLHWQFNSSSTCSGRASHKNSIMWLVFWSGLIKPLSADVWDGYGNWDPAATNFSFPFFTENRSKRDIITTLVQRGYPSDPVKAWKDLQKSNVPEADGDVDDASSVASSTSSTGGPDFGYLLSMSMLSLSREKKEELLKERDNKVSGSTFWGMGMEGCHSISFLVTLIQQVIVKS